MVGLGGSGGEGYSQCFGFLAGGSIWVRVRGKYGVGVGCKVMEETFEVIEGVG